MPQQSDISAFLPAVSQALCIDVRSPAEFAKGHIPGAENLPLFNDQERAEVGTLYKKQGREEAIKRGLEIVGPKMRTFIESIESLHKTRNADNNKYLLVYCWRGGMRSASVGWLFETYGFRVQTLRRGYKAFREWVRQTLEQPYRLCILGGNTGAGKTHLLHELQRQGECVVDLEKLAGHKGSAFGWLGESYQPTQEEFENLLATELSRYTASCRIWLEDESRRIGNVNIPNTLWEQMRSAPVVYLDMPLVLRVENLVQDYGGFSKEELHECLNRIAERLGGAAIKEATAALAENDYKKVAELSLRYYDKYYRRGLEQRSPDSIIPLPTHTRDVTFNAQQVCSCIQNVAL